MTKTEAQKKSPQAKDNGPTKTIAKASAAQDVKKQKPLVHPSDDRFKVYPELVYRREVCEDVFWTKGREIVAQGQKDPFYVFDIEVVKQRIDDWYKAFPEVMIYYPVKTNNDPLILKEMACRGQCFDCASVAEIKAVLDLGVSPDRIIFANPIKGDDAINFAREHGVNFMTFDSEEEARTLAELHPKCELLLRLAVTITDAPNPMSSKFGAEEFQWEGILKTCKDLGLSVKGVCFHVGSGGTCIEAYQQAIDDTVRIFNLAEELGLPKMTIVDIGGGFSMNSAKQENCFDKIAPRIYDILKQTFSEGVRIIGEPGRQITQMSTCLFIKVIALKEFPGGMRHYFVNSGVYQGFGCQVYDREIQYGQPLLPQAELQARIEQETEACMWGQSCAGLDWLVKNRRLPRLEKGDWLIYRFMGAYGEPIANTFNGFCVPQKYYL